MKFQSSSASFWMMLVMGGITQESTFVTSFAPRSLSSSSSPSSSSSVSVQLFGVPRQAVTQLWAGGDKDEYDDWYADFDPSAYESYDSSSGGQTTTTTTNNEFNSGPPRSGGGGRRSGGGGGGGGGGGRRDSSFNRAGGHDYVRDTSRDSSNVDEAAVDQLLSERVAAKKRRDFDTADDIRDQLIRDYAVGVFDKDRTWRTGCSSSGSGMGGGGRGGGGGRDRQGGGRGDRQFGSGGGGGGGRSRAPRDFGPNGHDYSLSPDAGPMNSEFTEPEVHELLAERLQAKMSRNYNLADEIQSQLISSGVYVHDGLKEWRADGVPFGDIGRNDGRPGRTQGSASDRDRPYSKSIYSADAAGDDEDTIQDLVDQRSKFKQLRAYDKADAIKEELLTEYDVYLDDRGRQWSVGGDFGKEFNNQREMDAAFRDRGFTKSASSLDISPQDEAYVVARLEERCQAKRDRNFDVADSIREELDEEFNIMINDKLRLWSVGGDFEADGGPKKRRTGYQRRGGGTLPEEDVQIISDLLATRLQAKKDRHFVTADDIRDKLLTTYNIAIDDKNLEWHVDSDEYVYVSSPGSASLSEEEVEIITSKLQERFACKKAKDYDQADDIRDELAEVYNVAIDDRTKEWRCLPSDNAGSSYEQRMFQEEAAASQVSAFKRTQPDRELEGALESIFDEEVEGMVGGDDSGASTLLANTTEEALLALKVPELKEKLRDAGLPVSGNKSELVERLLQASQ